MSTTDHVITDPRFFGCQLCTQTNDYERSTASPSAALYLSIVAIAADTSAV